MYAMRDVRDSMDNYLNNSWIDRYPESVIHNNENELKSRTDDSKAQELPVLFSTQMDTEGGLEIRVNSEEAE